MILYNWIHQQSIICITFIEYLVHSFHIAKVRNISVITNKFDTFLRIFRNFLLRKLTLTQQYNKYDERKEV